MEMNAAGGVRNPQDIAFEVNTILKQMFPATLGTEGAHVVATWATRTKAEYFQKNNLKFRFLTCIRIESNY